MVGSAALSSRVGGVRADHLHGIIRRQCQSNVFPLLGDLFSQSSFACHTESSKAVSYLQHYVGRCESFFR